MRIKLKQLANIAFILLVTMQMIFGEDEATCEGPVNHFGHDKELFYDLQEDTCCGFSLKDNSIIKECP